MATAKKDLTGNRVQGRPFGMTPEQMSLRGRMGAHAIHARYDSRELTSNARKAFLDRFEREVDPDGRLSPEERSRRAMHARKVYFSKLALKSARARSRRKDG
jgi:hypothetical protein